MIDRSCFLYRLIVGICLLSASGCSHRQSSASAASTPPKPVVVAAPCTFNGSGIQFDYPGDWKPTKGQTALFAISAPDAPAGCDVNPSLNLDVPKLPWHLPGMITLGMVANGYISDLKKSQIPDAVCKEQLMMTICGEKAKRVTCCGHKNGKSSTDMAIILVHADRVYILSADSDDTGCDCARKALDAAVASMKWTK
jgi:hypothetical protein